jgi:tetratricopeptide (TPR) repeat protein
MVKNQIIGLIFLVLLLSSCGINKNRTSALGDKISKVDYAYIDQFHEGLRFKQRGEVDNAILAFNKCIESNKSDDAVYFALSELYTQKGEDSQAITSLEKAINVSPENIWYLQEATYLNFESGKYDAAISGFEKLVKEQPSNIEWLYGLAEAFMKAGKYKKAIETLDKTEFQVGKHPELAIQKFKLYLAMKKPNKGIELMNEAILTFPEESVLVGTLVDYYFQAKQNDKAIQMLELLVKKDPDNGRAHIGLADIYRQLGKKEAYFSELKAGFKCVDTDIDTKMKMLIDIQESKVPMSDDMLELAEILVLLYPEDAKSHSIQGDFFLQIGKDSLALNAYKKALTFDKSRFPIWNQVLLMEYQERDYNSLYEDSKVCLELYPSQPTIYLLNGISANQIKKYEAAVEVLELGKDLIIDDRSMQAEFYGQIGEAYFALERYTEGKSNYEFALNFNHNSTLNLNNFAYRLAMAKIDLNRAEELIAKANDISPNQPHFLDTYGWILFQKEEYSKSKEFFEKAFVLNPNDAIIVEHLGDVNYKLGKNNIAVDFWEKALKMGSENLNLNEKIKNKEYYEPKY